MLVLIVVLVLLGAFVFYVSIQPGEFNYSRKTTVNASAEKTFSQINDFHNWKGWSPWANIDPSMKLDITGAPAGVGAVYHWSGNGKAGEGIMKLVESKELAMVKIEIQFIKPFAANNVALFTLTPSGTGGTEVVWGMSGKRPFIIKLMGIFLDMENLIGKDFEKGLASLKKVVEA